MGQYQYKIKIRYKDAKGKWHTTSTKWYDDSEDAWTEYDNNQLVLQALEKSGAICHREKKESKSYD